MVIDWILSLCCVKDEWRTGYERSAHHEHETSRGRRSDLGEALPEIDIAEHIKPQYHRLVITTNGSERHLTVTRTGAHRSRVRSRDHG